MEFVNKVRKKLTKIIVIIAKSLKIHILAEYSYICLYNITKQRICKEKSGKFCGKGGTRGVEKAGIFQGGFWAK